MAIFLITAPSGAGKTSIVKAIQKQGGYWLECISHTTRDIREGEVDGEAYYFISKPEFEDLDTLGGFAERVEYDGNYYGVSKDEINAKKGSHIAIIVEYNGYLQIKKQYPEAVGIFVYMSKEDCMANMLLRGDSLEKAMARISTYDDEIVNRKDFDYVIKNVRNRMTVTCDIIKGIVRQYNP